MFAKSLMDAATTNEIEDVTEWPTNIHEYHAMIATAQATALQLQELGKKTNNEPEEQPDQKEEVAK